MVNIVCVKVGTKYNANDVNRLYRMVDLNMSKPYNFYCFTDDEKGLLLPIKKKRVYDLPLHSYWWKMTVFDKTMWDNNEPTLYLDLDVIIQNDITYLFEKVNRELIRIGYIGTDVIKHYSASRALYRTDAESPRTPSLHANGSVQASHIIILYDCLSSRTWHRWLQTDGIEELLAI